MPSPRVMPDLAAHGWLPAVRREDDRFSWRERVTEFDDSGDSGLPCQDSNSAATTSNPRTRMGPTSASLETTVEAGKSLAGEPLRHLLAATQRSSPTRPRWVRACASPDPYLKGLKLLSVGQYAPAAASRKADVLAGRYYCRRHGHVLNEGRALFAPCRLCRAPPWPCSAPIVFF